MFANSTVAAALLLSLLVPATAQAQANEAFERPNLVLFANGGGNSSLTDLDDAGSASLETGWSAGGGVGVQLNPYLAVRGTFDFAQSDGEGATALSGQSLNRYFYGGDVQLRYPTASGFAPYLLLGAGAVTIDSPDVGTFDSFTKFAGKGGLGVEYALPQSSVGLFAQASSYVYDFDRNGFDKTQVDLLWTAGLSYRLSY
ncbi:MAG: outer membrane beta-barrel protein [Gemmatimonadales bacterium]